jgi:hypothetical protein
VATWQLLGASFEPDPKPRNVRPSEPFGEEYQFRRVQVRLRFA